MKLNFKRLIAMFLSIMMVVGMMPTIVFAADDAETTTYVAKVGETECADAAALVSALQSASGDVTVEVYDKITTTGISLSNANITKLSFVGNDTDAEICVNGFAYIDVRSTSSPIEYTDLILSHTNGGYGIDGRLQEYFSTYNGGNVTYTNCSFPNGVTALGSTNGTTVTFNNCTFNNTTSGQYSLWVDGNGTEVVVNGGTFCGVRGVKLFAENGSAFSTLEVIGATFSDTITEKAAVVLTRGESVELTGNTFSNTTEKVQVDDDYASEISGKTVTIDNTEYTVDSDNLQLEEAAPEVTTGTNSYAYTKEVDGYVRVWGEGGGNAKESFVLKLYSGETLIATTQLNNVDGIIDGDIYVTWNFFYPSSNDAYWTTTWEEGHPNADAQPTQVELYIDGTLVATTDAQMNGADGISPVVWAELGGVKKASLKGSGTAEDPFLINNLEDLVWFRDKVDEQASDGSTQFAGKYFLLTADIDLTGINWNPIGSMSGDHGSFKGIFDGNGHTISNLNVQQEGNGLGLFARTAGNAEIKNLILNNVTVKSTNNSNYVGGLVGNSYASTKINNVHVTGTIDISGRGYIGGISGHGYVVMDNVSVVGTGTISSTFWCAGGILGYGGEGATHISNAHVEGVTVTSAAGGLGAIIGMAEDNNGTQPISGENLSAKNVEIKTYTGAYGDSYANYALGYLYGGNPTSELTGTLTVENVNIITSTGAEPQVNDAVADVNSTIYFDLQSAVNAAQADNEIKVLRDVTLTDTLTIPADKTVTLELNGNTLNGYFAPCEPVSLTVQNGSIKNTNSGFSAIEINAGKLALINVNVESARHAVRIDGAVTATIDGGTYCSAIGDGTGTYHAVNVSGAADVTIQKGTFVGPKGTTADSGSALKVQSGATVTIEGGEFSGGKLKTLSVDGTLSVKGGTFDQDPSAYLADGYAALLNLDDKYVVGEKPTATVNNLGVMTIPAGNYMVYGNGDNAKDMPLSFVMQFLANQTAEDMTTSPFAEWYGDFVITFTGIENDFFVADGCYLAGFYGEFGWVKVPVDGMTIEDGARYPVMLSVGMGQKYDYICSGVQDFKCALYLAPEILEANPNLKVNLELAVVDNSKGSDAAATALINGEKIYPVTDYEYVADDFVPKTYVAEVNGIKYETLEEALEVTQAGDTVIILSGDYTTDITLNKAITVAGETDAEGNNLVNITGRIAAHTGATVQNLNVHNDKTDTYDCALNVNGKDIVIDGVCLSGYNTMRYCYATGTITIKNSTINGSNFAIHFDGSTGGNVVIENCDITGWCSYASIINSVSYTNCAIDQGNYTGHRYYNKNISFNECDFAEGMQIDLKSSGTTVAIVDKNMTVAEAKALFKDPYYVANGNVTLNDAPITYAASATGKYYDTLQDAIDACPADGATYYVYLRSNNVLTEPVTVPADKKISLNLNGFTISMEDSSGAGCYMIKNEGTLSIEGKGTLTFNSTTPSASFSYSTSTIGNAGTLIVESGIIENTTVGGASYAIDTIWYAKDVSITINGGTITAKKVAVRQVPFSTTAKNVVNVTGGTLTGETAGLQLHHTSSTAANLAEVNISGGTFNGTYAFYTYYYGAATAAGTDIEISNGTFDGYLYLYNGAANSSAHPMKVAVTGGTFKSGVYVYTCDNAGNQVSIGAISGGTFAEDVSEYCAEGYACKANDDGTYGVEKVEISVFRRFSTIHLGNELALNFYMTGDSTFEDGQNYYAVVTKTFADGRADVVTYVAKSEWGINGTYYVTADSIAAKEMGDTVTVQIFKGEIGSGVAVSELWSDSVLDYSTRLLANSTSDAEKRSAVDMLNYGAAAQIHFKYNTENPANASLTEEEKSLASAEVTKTNSRTNTVELYKWTTASFESNIVLNMYYGTEITKALVSYTDHYGKTHSYEMTAANGGIVYDETNQMYKVVIGTLVVADVDTMITCVVYNGATTLGTTVDSVGSYLARAIAGSSGNEHDLYVEAAKFTASAYAYLHK